MSTILTLGIILFSISSLYFLIKPKAGLNSPFLVSITTLISYTLMLQGDFLIGSPETGLYWTRWAFYGLSCPLLIYEISNQVGLNLKQNFTNIFLTVLVMLTGVLASISRGNFKLAFFVLSCVVFGAILYSVFTAQSTHQARVKAYMIFGWSVFPLVFIISHEGYGLITNPFAALLYLGLDFLTKIVFYVHFSRVSTAEKTK